MHVEHNTRGAESFPGIQAMPQPVRLPRLAYVLAVIWGVLIPVANRFGGMKAVLIGSVVAGLGLGIVIGRHARRNSG